MNTSIAERIVAFAKNASFEALPIEVVQKAKLLLLDTIGICIGSTTMDFGKGAMQVVHHWSGMPECTLIGTNDKAPAHHAAFLNGILAHGQDYDDTHTKAVIHPSAAIVPAVLAIAERNKLSGNDLLLALVIGTEIAIRIALPARGRFHDRGIHMTPLCTVFSTALIAGVSRGLSVGQVVNAIGISGSFAFGLAEYIRTGASSKRLHAGWAAHSGIVAADFCEVGYTGPETIIEGSFGLYGAFLHGEDDIEFETIFDRIGADWEMLDVRPKLYPCCHYLQAFLDCAANLRGNGLNHNQIGRIECYVAEKAVSTICEPWHAKLQPTDGYSARFSLPFAVALMFEKGKARTAEFDGELYKDENVRGFMKKICYSVDANLNYRDMPARIKITFIDGSSRSFAIDEVRGASSDPFSQDELLGKFFDTTSNLHTKKSERLADSILRLEQLDDINDLFADVF